MAIWSTKRKINATDPRIAAGVSQEKGVAFYLRRAFKDSEKFIIFNDYSFQYDGEKAQIDHLIIHKYGFTILESKSVKGEVKVNSKGEWSRSHRGTWSGMPSPLKQAELQLGLLKKMLTENAEGILPKMLGLQQNFGGRKWNSFCVVSSNAILHRDTIPKDIEARIIKSEFCIDTVKAIGERSIAGALFSTDPSFSFEELQSIGNFLVARASEGVELTEQAGIARSVTTGTEKPDSRADADRLWDSLKNQPYSIVEATPNLEVSDKTSEYPIPTKTLAPLLCKQCGNDANLSGQYGRYGYYAHCGACDVNTSMKQSCQVCGCKTTKIVKRKNQYSLTCPNRHSYLVFEE